jgi:hypothetical protein
MGSAGTKRPSAGALRCRRKFLRFFPGGFHDETSIDWERGYKWEAHERWLERLDPAGFKTLLERERFTEIAEHVVRVESRTNLLFSFEKMALRDAVRSPEGARQFSLGLYDFLHGTGEEAQKFASWVEVVGALPRRQTRVLTWPVVTVFGFIAAPGRHIFLKPTVTRVAARAYGYDFAYAARPSWDVYASLLGFARAVRRDVADLRPRDLIDIQSFIWVQGSDEYEE